MSAYEIEGWLSDCGSYYVVLYYDVDGGFGGGNYQWREFWF